VERENLRDRFFLKNMEMATKKKKHVGVGVYLSI